MSRIISRGTRKMPLPMMVPTTMAVAWLRRGRGADRRGLSLVGNGEAGWLMR